MKRRAYIAPALALAAALGLAACTPAGGAAGADGAAFEPPAQVLEARFDPAAAIAEQDGAIDVSHASEGYVAVRASGSERVKLQVSNGDMSYNYDLPAEGEDLVVPLNMGDGAYEIRLMRNTSSNNYVETAFVSLDVQLASEFEPFLRPNVFCSYSEDSACVAKARELVAGCPTQGEAVERICTWVVDNIRYDTYMAGALEGKRRYVPNPDRTLAQGEGICFDYASLGAAMLRSQGIPTKVVTGYVSPQDVYHAWIMVYIDGAWHNARFSVERNVWSRVDLTFAANSSKTALVGDARSYTDRYVY